MKKRTKEKLWKGTRGAISILLVCLLLPFISVAAVYLEAGRYQSGIRALDESLGSSAISTLANIDSYLLNRFGLMAVKQKTDDVDGELTSTLTSYFDRQETTDRNTVAVDSIAVNGVYPLSDPSVLKQQVLEASSAMAPVKFISEFGDLNSLVKQIQKSMKFLYILDTATDCINLFEKTVAAIEAIDDAKDQMKEAKKAREAYDAAFSAWQGAVVSLAQHLATERPDPDEHPVLAEIWDATKSSRTSSAENARVDYLNSISDLISAFDKLQDCLNEALKNQQALGSQAFSTVFGAINNGIDLALTDEDDDETKAFGNTMKGIMSSTESTLKTSYSKLSDLTDTFSLEAIQNAVVGLQTEKARVSAYSTGSITGSTAQPDSGTYHFVVLDKLTDPEALEEFLDEAEEELNKADFLDVLEAIVELFTELFNTETVVDAELNIRLDTGYYNANMGGLPSSTKSSYTNPFADQDEAASKVYLEEIDPDYDADDPYGLIANSVTGKFEKLMDNIEKLKSRISDIGDAKGFVKKIKAIVACLKQAFSVIASIIDLFKTIVTDLLSNIGKRFLVSTYLAFNLPNRTNYESGTGLTGYKYGNIARHDSAPLSNLPIYGELSAILSNGQTGYCFRGAEMEYVMWGSEYELVNQLDQFIALLVLRMFLNIPKIFTDEMWSGIIQPLIPLYGVGYIVGLGAAVAEAFVDTTLLVNGAEISLIKDHVYLSPAGIPDLIEQLSYVKLSDAKKKDIIKSAAKATDTKYEDYTKPSTSKPDKTEKPLIDWDKYGKGLMTFDYTEYSLILMLLFTSEEKALYRLADLIQCEKTLRNLTTDASLSQQTSGEYSEFNISKAYTMIRVEASGAMRPMLPVSTMSTSDTLEVSRVLYRGY